MLRPSKHAHPDRTVIAAALVALQRLRAQRVCDYDALFNFVRKAIKGGDVLFLPAVNFLFLMGLVDYHVKTDAFEYVGKNETV